jgi:hypothetical protein
VSTTVVGDADTIYTATLRIRGLVECFRYSNYTTGTDHGRYFTHSNPAVVLPVTVLTGANQYCLRVTNGGGGAGPSVASATFVNNSPSPEPVLPSLSKVVDFTFVVQVRGGSVVSLEGNSVDNLEWSNVSGLIVNGGSPPIQVTEPYRLNVGHGGQWLQCDCTSLF